MMLIAFKEAASAVDQNLYEKQLDLFLDPFDEEVIAEAERQGLSHEWINRLKILQYINSL